MYTIEMEATNMATLARRAARRVKRGLDAGVGQCEGGVAEAERAMTRGSASALFAALAILVWALPGCSSSAPAEKQAPVNAGGASSGGAPPVLGDPIDVPATEQWVWVPVEGTQCADGTEAGVGVNFTDQSRELVVWFQGNGVCYDA